MAPQPVTALLLLSLPLISALPLTPTRFASSPISKRYYYYTYNSSPVIIGVVVAVIVLLILGCGCRVRNRRLRQQNYSTAPPIIMNHTTPAFATLKQQNANTVTSYPGAAYPGQEQAGPGLGYVNGAGVPTTNRPGEGDFELPAYTPKQVQVPTKAHTHSTSNVDIGRL